MRIPKEIVENIIASVNLPDYIKSRGIDLREQGSSFKAKCPFHSERTPSFSIPVGEQYFNCFGCGEAGDLISFIMKYDEVSFPDAVRAAATYAGINLPEEGFISPEDVELRRDRELLNGIYLSAADYCHQALSVDLRDWLKSKYGFTDELIDNKKIGYSDGSLFVHMHKKLGYEEADLLKSGLFVRTRSGLVRDFFYTRVVFWYWKRGFPAYAIGRETEYTRNLKGYDEAGGRRKYVKLAAYNEEYRDYVSKEVQNKFIYNEDLFLTARKERPVYGVITEGITDALLAEQKGIPVMSPVTKQFRRDDIEKLVRICRNLKDVFIANDSEDNESGLKGALATASELSQAGINAHLVFIPRPEGVDKVDLNDLLKTIRDEEHFREFLRLHSVPYLDYLTKEAIRLKKEGRDRESSELVDQALYETRNMSPMAQEEFFKAFAKEAGLRLTAVREQFKYVMDANRSAPEYKESSEYINSLQELGFEQQSDSIGHQLYKSLVKKGAKFFRPGGMDSTDVLMALDGRFYRISSEESPFTMYLQYTYGLNFWDHAVKKAIFEFKTIAHYNATRIKRQTWLYCDRAAMSLYMGIGHEDNRLLKITPDRIEMVFNGEDDGIFVNLPDDTVDPWEFDPNVDKRKVAKKLVDMFTSYAPTSDEDALMVLMALFAFPLKRFVDTTPILKVHGSSSAGKTQIAKMILNLFYGNERGIGDMTDASKFDQSDKRMILVFDNVENTNAGAIEQFLLYSASGGGREKRDRSTESGTVKQIVDSLPVLTSIHPFGKKELVNRSLDVQADTKYHDKKGDKKSPTVMNDELIDIRNDALSVWPYVLQEAMRRMKETRDMRNAISAKVGNHFKERLDGYFSLMWLVADILLGYVGWKKEDVEKLALGWVENQSITGIEAEKNISSIYYFFDLMARGLAIARKENAGFEFAWMPQMLEVAYVEESTGRVTIEATGQQILAVFKRLAKDFGERNFEYDSTQKLMTRIYNDVDVLEENGWIVELSFKRHKGSNLHRFIYHVLDHDDFLRAITTRHKETAPQQDWV